MYNRGHYIKIISIRLIMYKQITVLFSCCMIMHTPLFGMDYDFVLREIVVRHIDHDMHRQFAMVSKACNTTVEDTYRPKKKLIEEFLQQEKPRITGHISWNRDFSRCAWINVSHLGFGIKNLQLMLVGLTDKSDIKKSSGSWEVLYGPVFEDNNRPFFDKEGRACFYNWDGRSIYEHSIDLNNDAQCYRCLYEISKRYVAFEFSVDFNMMLCLPILLKAFLQSRQTRTWMGREKFYNIEGVTIPENYKYKIVREDMIMKPFISEAYESYDFTGKRIIEKRYEEQQREKKSGGD